MRKFIIILAIMTTTLVSVGQRASNNTIVVNQYIYDLLSNNHKIFYGDGTGNVVELSLGADGSYLMSNGATLAPSFETPAGGVTELVNLSDVNTSTPTNRNMLIADGVDWESRAFVEADISDFGTYLTSEVDGSVSNEGSLTVAAGAANTSIINSNTSGQTGVTISGDVTIDVTESSNTITIASSMIQNVDNGAKTASFTHDAASASIGGYTLTTASAVTVSIHNLESGMMGTIDLDIATNPSAITVNTYSDAGSTGLTEVVIGNAIASEASKMTTISYSCVYNGTSTYVKLIYGQE